ncbi:MAG: hypothetical protein KKB21_04270 [Nanoarchaeota archaeon]|nr:hypothetical protein [Nanoarchaeota archaeon]MBU4086762.1 hypothetical protein [Nanoarchaeota archaeon]
MNAEGVTDKKLEEIKEAYRTQLGEKLWDMKTCLDILRILAHRKVSARGEEWRACEDLFYDALSLTARKMKESVVPYMTEYRRLRSACERQAQFDKEKQDFPDEYREAKSQRDHYSLEPRWRI